MIKLIAADMDGTLLDSQKRLPPELPGLLTRLNGMGVQFAVASGRQYYNLEKLFLSMGQDILYICENGTMVFHNGKPVYLDPIRPEIWKPLLLKLRGIHGACPILCCPEGAYYENTDPEFLRNGRLYYEKFYEVKDLMEVTACVCKIAVYDLGLAETNSYPVLKQATAGQLQAALSGEHWVDLMGNANKGSALTAIGKRYGIEIEERMAFGDYLNDCELLDACYYSFAMSNAHPILKQHARFQAASNDENGVVRAICETLGLDDGIAVREVPYGGPEYKGNLELRDAVLRQPLGLRLADEDLSAESEYHHLAAIQGEKVIGTMMLLPDPERPDAMRMKQVAVSPEYRGRKIGARLQQLAFRTAKFHGCQWITVHARKTAEGFYQKMGFKRSGPDFIEIGIPHLPMQLQLK